MPGARAGTLCDVNCPNCQYSLWGIRARSCPECGTGFAPSQFRFRRGRVKFCCPHCEQAYFGTDENGLLLPREFECAGCARRVALDEMVLRPAKGLASAQCPENPWLIRARVGRVRAFVGTLWAGAIRPVDLLRATPPKAEQGLRFFAGVVMASGFGLVSVVALFAGSMVALRSSPGNTLTPIAAVVLGVPVAALLAMILVWLLGTIMHGVLRLTGPTGHPRRRTMHALTYTAGPVVLCGVPCLGFYLFPVSVVWWCVLVGFALVAAQGVRAWRAAVVAVLMGAILLAPPAYGIFRLLAFSMYYQRLAANVTPGSAPAPPVSNPSGLSSCQLIGAALEKYVAQHGEWPAHAVVLLGQGDVSWQEITEGDPGVMGTFVGPWKLQDWPMLKAQAQQDTVKEVVKGVPPGGGAHRVGVGVFVYHGLPLRPDPEVWLVIRTPTPSIAGYEVYKAGGGKVTAPTRALFLPMLDAQNDLRKRLGVPLVPDPESVKSGAP